jgi:hypothetical protein
MSLVERSLRIPGAANNKRSLTLFFAKKQAGRLLDRPACRGFVETNQRASQVADLMCQRFGEQVPTSEGDLA